MISLRIGLIAACLLAAGLASAKPLKATAARPVASAPAPEPALPAAVRVLGGIEEYRLPNGLQVLLFPDATQTTIAVNITYRVGSRHEGAGEYGMAHLLEHLLFKGSARHPDIEGALAERGVGNNARTGLDRTSYFAFFNANADTLAFLIDLEADRMVNSRVAKADLDTEMTVVRNEFERGESDPAGVLSLSVSAAAFAWHPYGRGTLGTLSDIENVPIEKLQAFYKRYYRPDNATLMIAGSFDKATTLALIARHFGAIARPSAPIPKPYTTEPAQDGERSVVVRRVGGRPLLTAAYHVPARAHPDVPALIVYGLLMDLQPGGQLNQRLVDAVPGVSASIRIGAGADPGLALVEAVLPPDADVDKAQAVLLDVIEGRSVRPFDDGELQRVRNLASNTYRQQMKHPAVLIQTLSDFIGAGDWRLLFRQLEGISKVTLADVERVRAAYFKPANRTLGRYLPSAAVERVEIPAAPPLEPYLAELQPPPQVEEGELLDPTPAALESRTERTTLPSGIALHTLRKQTRGNMVVLEMRLRWGDRDATYPYKRTDLLGRLMAHGSAGYSKQQLQDALTTLRADLGVTSYDQGATLTVSAERDTLLPALRIAADVLRRPTLPQDYFDSAIRDDLANIEASRLDPVTLLWQPLRGPYNAARGATLGHPDYLMTADESLASYKAATLDELKRFHAEYWSANEAQVSVAGALPDGLADEVERLFGDWKKPAAPKYVRHIPQHVAVPAARFDAIARDQANALVLLHQALPMNSTTSDCPALELAVRIFGGGSESRLFERVRQKEGLSYHVRAVMEAGFWGNAGSFAIDASYAPDQRDRVIAVVQEEVARMAAQGVTVDELARAKKGWLEAQRYHRTTPGDLVVRLAGLGEIGETWGFVQKREDAIAAVTVDQVNAAWRKHIKPEDFMISTAGDFRP